MIEGFIHPVSFIHSMPSILAALAGPVTPDLDASVLEECLNTVFAADSVALSCGAAVSAARSAGWDAMWADKIGTESPEFVIMMNFSRYIAGPAIAFWFIYAIRQIWRNGLSEIWMEIAPVVFLALILYTNNAAIPRQMVLASRALMNYNNQAALEIANYDVLLDEKVGIEDKLREITDFALIKGAIVEARSQCNGYVRNGEMRDCLEIAEREAEALIQGFLAEHGDNRFTLSLKTYVADTISNPLEKIRNVLAEGPQKLGENLGQLVLGKVVNSAATVGAEGWMAMMNQIAQYVVELSWLYTAIVLPIPLALGFYPGTRNILIGWAVGFLTLGFFKLNLNIATSLVVSQIYARGPGEPLFDLTLLALGVLVMAFGMTALGGMTMLAGINTALAGLTLGVVNFSAKGIGGR